MKTVQDIIYKEESYALMGACFEVYREMGPGFLEAVYQECVEMELADRQVPFRPKVSLALTYKHRPLKSEYVPDFTCYDKIIVELKAMKDLGDDHRAQVLNYLRATGYRLGLLVNFGHHPQLEYQRLVL